MNQLKVNFLNWRPDQDEYQLEGLVKAQNVVHDTEGYKPVYLQTTTSFSTGIAAASSVLSVVASPGPWPGTAFTSYVEDGTTPVLRFGYVYSTAAAMYAGAWSTTGYPTAHAFATAGASGHAVVAHDTCYLGEYVFMVSVAEQGLAATGTTQTVTALAVGSNFS